MKLAWVFICVTDAECLREATSPVHLALRLAGVPRLANVRLFYRKVSPYFCDGIHRVGIRLPFAPWPSFQKAQA